ncbi:MAG: DUF3010 family protein [Candidatus Aminicenantales bacterium]
MTVCGIELKGSEAHLVLLRGSKTDFVLLDDKPRKLVLDDDERPDAVRGFRDALYAFFRENSVEMVAIRKRVKSGKYAGGSIGFKLEGIAQLYTDCRVVLCHPQTIKASLRRCPIRVPASLPTYQQAAFETAYSVLP